MKIAILGPAFPYRGGIANFSERLANEFVNSGDTIHLYTFKMMYPDFIFPGKTQYAETPLQFPLTITRNINSVNPLNWFNVGKQIQQQNFDIILVAYSIPFLGPSLGTIARIVKKSKQTKIISIIHNLNPHEKRIGDSVLSNYFLNSCDAHIALSKKVEEDIFLKDKTHPVIYYPHPVYDTFGKIIDKKSAKQILQLDENTSYIIFFGLIREYKGLDLLLHAMADDKLKNENIKLIVAGEFYSDVEKYQNIIKENKLENKIIIYNQFIPDNEVNTYFCASDIVIQPYRHATQSGITQICYHFNKPMIVTNVGGLPETVPNNIVGLVCEPNSESIAQAILYFYHNKKESEFINNIVEEKKKYSWSGLVQKIKEKYLSK